MSNVVDAYFNNRTPEVEALYEAFRRGEVDIYGNRRDAPGYSLANSVSNPNLTDTSVIGQTPTQTTKTSANAQTDTPSDIMTEADVERLYQDVLDRKADPYGLEFYTGMSYAQAKREIEAGPEYLTNEYYKEKFGTPLTYAQRALFPADMSLADRYAKIDSFAVPGGDTGTGTGTGTGTDTGGTDTGGISTLSPFSNPTGAVPIDLGLERTFRGVVDRDPRQEDYDFYLKEYGDTFDFADRADLTNRLRAEQLQRFETQLGLPAATPSGPIQPRDPLDFTDFNKTLDTVGIESLKPKETVDGVERLVGGTMASAFANPQFTSPFSIQTEQQELPKDTFTQLGDLFSEQFKEEIRGPLEEQIRAEVAEEAEGKRAGGLASLGYRRGGVVDENGIPRLFIGGLFKGIGRALKGAFKGVTKIAPFVLPFIPGFQGLALGQQALLGGVAGGFAGGDGKFDLKRALTSGLTTYGIGSLAKAAGTPVGPEGSGVSSAADPSRATYQPGAFRSTAGAPPVNSYSSFDTSTAGTSTAPPAATNPAAVDPNLTGIDRLQAEAVGTGQRIGDTVSNIATGNVESGKALITPAVTTVGGISATKAADEIAKQEAEYKALTAADAEEKKRKRRLALEAIRRNPFGYNKGGISSLPARYLDGAGDGMSDSIRANIGGMQEARLADGEFVVPADVVADLGNGSSNAGAERLYSMMDRIRQARHGTTKQPPEVNVNKTLPA